MPPLNRVLGRLSPILVTMNKDHIPTFESTTISSPASHYTEKSWSEILSQHSTSTIQSSLPTMLPPSNPDTKPSSPSAWVDNTSHLVPLDASALQSKRLVIFGEQHHQSRVLAAQMTVLQLLHDRYGRNNESHGKAYSDVNAHNKDDGGIRTNGHDSRSQTSLSNPTPKPVLESDQGKDSRLVLLLEPLNHRFNSHLHSWSSNHLSTSQLQHLYDTASTEGFDLTHYLPLMELARSLSIPIYGGFPPREWARIVHREGIEALRRHEVYGEQIVESGFDEEESRWDGVRRISGEYEAYIRGMISGGKPITFKSGDVEDENEDDTIITRGSNASSSNTAKANKGNGQGTMYEKGILPAQALKDAFFAWEIDRRLIQCSSSLTHDDDKSRSTTGQTLQRVNPPSAHQPPIILAICGLGHCEYGLGVCERITGCDREEIFTIASKAWDQREYQGDQLSSQQKEEEDDMTKTKDTGTKRKKRFLADCVVPYEPDP